MCICMHALYRMYCLVGTRITYTSHTYKISRIIMQICANILHKYYILTILKTHF